MTDQQQRLLKAHISLALLEELGRRPTDQELQQYLRVLSKAVRGFNAHRQHPNPYEQQASL